MKLEISESLVYSYLRHIKECQICQMNWKASPKWTPQNLDLCQTLMEQAIERFNNPFKKTRSIDQLLRQGEIDVLGIDVINNHLFATEVAFHSRGLITGNSREDTVSRITKKIIRIVLTIIAYFNHKESTVIFMSPKVSQNLNENINDRVQEINEFLKNNNIKIEAQYYSNEKFREQILNQILSDLNDVEDTAELFLRSCKLINSSGYQITPPTPK